MVEQRELDERMADVGRGIELCYESLGDPAAPTVLLVMGLGMQLVGWPDGFCDALVARGFRVVRFDNRDCGRSTHVGGPPPSLARLALRRVRSPYLIADMAADAAGLLDAIGVRAAHVVGVSMGGMIAQAVAARHPERVLSLTSIMSTTGSLRVGQPALRIYPELLRRAPGEREAFAEHVVRFFEAIGSPASTYPPDREWIRAQALRSWERASGDGLGQPRQLGAIVASGDRTRELRTIATPTTVIHGTRDRLIKPSGGHATAAAIAGSRLVMIDGMGHDVPEPLWPRFADEIERVAARAQPPGRPFPAYP
ncbi:MAG TPA: alpha/beta hydrolase [Solirubrobacteraceae bacterium]|nr:alpha/beta hydrolase [Solirubrobacteraceae bacterium]